MGKIIDPVSYKRMAESYAKPAYKLREGVGAGYQLTFIDIKLTNVKVGKTEKDADGFDVAKFTADIVPGEYGWYADHPYWTAASKGNPEPYNFDSSDNPFASKAVITGGKVEGTCDDGGTAWRSEGSPWSEKQFIDEIESETFIIQDSYSGGWVHSPMTDTLEWEVEVRPGYERYIDETPSERGNLAVIEKIFFNFDPDWVMDYEEALDYAENPDEYEEDEWDDADDDESPAFYDDPDTGRQWYESKIRESKDESEEDISYLKYLLRKEKVSGLDKEERWELQDLISKYGYPEEDEDEEDDFYVNPEDYDKEGTYEEYLRYCDATDGDPMSEEEWRWTTGIHESKMREYSSSRSIKNYKPQHDFKRTKKYQDEDGSVGDIVKIIGVECSNSAVPARGGLLGVKYDFSKRPEFKDYKKKGLEQEFSDFKNALGHKGEIVKALPENSHVKESFIIKVLDGPSKDKEFEFYPGEFYVIKGRLDNKYRFSNYEESKKSGKSRLNEGFGWGHENLPHPEDDPDVDAFAYPEKGDTVKIYKTNTSSVGEMASAKVYHDRFNACGQLGKVKDVYYHGGVPSDYLVEVLTGESKGCELRLPQESVHLYVGGKDALKEYTVKDWYEENPSKEAHTKADPLDRYYAIQVKEVNPDYRKYFHHTAEVGDFWAGSAFTFVDEFSDAELYETPKKAEEALKEVNDAMDRLAKHKRFEGRPYEFEIVGGYKNVLTERIHKKTYSDHIIGYTEPGEDEEIFYDRKHAGYVSDGQAYIRKDCPEEVYETFPDYIETNLSFLEESKLKEDLLASQVRQSVLDVQAAKKQVDEDVAVLDRKVDKVSNDLVRVATNRRDVISEAKTRFVELDSPLKISGNGKIDEIEVKKILRKLAADRILRVNAHYNIKDSEGKVTYWDFLHSQDEGYQYVFVQEMTGNYCYSNMLYLNKRKGKIDLKNTKWSSYEIPEDYYDSYKMTEATRLTHRIVLKPEDSGYRLTHADKLRFHSKEDAESKLSQMNASMGSRLASKGLHLEIEEIPYTPKPRNTRTQDPDYENPFEVGDILEGDFGYSMILPVWVQVVSKTAKTVTVRRLEDKVVSYDGYGQAGTKLPIPNSFSKGWGDSYEEQRCIVKKGYRTGESDPKKRYFIDFQGKMMNIWDGEARDFDTYD